MIRKPVRWRRLGTATLASFAIAVTALAAQVSPPNAQTPAPVAGTTAPTERKVITLDNATLDRYVGSYKLADTMIYVVKREGNQLKTQLTGQGVVDVFPESETKFFYKVVDAQVEFAMGPNGSAESVTLYQNGQVMPMPRVDAAVADQLAADLAARIASQSPAPGADAAVRRLSDGAASGKPNYDEMGPALAKAAKDQLSTMQPMLSNLGALKSVAFRNVSGQGLDVFLATYEKGTLVWRIGLGPDGKIVNAMVTPDF